MQYGFVIDNRKCIGCHACTVACKSEHDVPVGVNRTWVKQVEKGTFPDTKRLFSVMRCNHCTDAPCVTICPTQALFTREDGIVDFDNDRCIGCKGCMQACPYDALYIDPETHTAAKCNYCAHRVDIGLEPACVNVCPEHAIISGDLSNPDTEIAQLVAEHPVSVRKPEAGTMPNVFYINGDEVSLRPELTDRSEEYFWNSQDKGVGHFARYADQRKGHNKEIAATASRQIGGLLQEKGAAKRIYDTPDKGLLWGTEVVWYVWTKAIAAGVFLAGLISLLWNEIDALGMMGSSVYNYGIPVIGLVFLTLTGLLLIADLDQPKRFLYVLLRPQWKSWLVKGGYAITLYGALLTVMLAVVLFRISMPSWLSWSIIGLLGAAALITAIYTAFLFAQAKGRDFWQSWLLAPHMLVSSITAGAAALVLGCLFTGESYAGILSVTVLIGIGLNLLISALDLLLPHKSADTKATVAMIRTGSYSKLFWVGAILVGNLIPAALILATGFTATSPLFFAAAVLVLAGLWIQEKVWVEAPQRLPLS